MVAAGNKDNRYLGPLTDEPYRWPRHDQRLRERSALVTECPLFGMRARLRRRCRHRLPSSPMRRATLRPRPPLTTAHTDQDDQIWS
jgi:hypothetical protein